MSLYFRCSQTGAVLFPGDIWKCVQSFGCYYWQGVGCWPIVGRDQG